MKLQVGEESVGIMSIDGALTIQRSAELRDALLEALPQVEKLMLDLEKVTDFDLSCLQLFCSAHRTFLSKNKCIQIKEIRPEAFELVLGRLGFSNNICGAEEIKTCIWSGRS